MEITGILKAKFDTQVVSDKFKKREFVLTTEANTQYPQHLAIQVTQDKCLLLDAVNVGDELKVSINLRGREWNGPQGIKYFNTIEAWKIDRMKWDNPNPVQQQSNEQPVVNNFTDDGKDLPF